MKKKTRTENVAGGAVKLAPSILAADFNRPVSTLPKQWEPGLIVSMRM